MEFLNWVLPAARQTLEISMKASILIGIILIVQAVLRDRLPARWRYLLWMVLLLRLLIPNSVESRVSVFNWLSVEPATVVYPVYEAPDRQRDMVGMPESVPMPSDLSLPEHQPLQPEFRMTTDQLLTAIWSAGVLAFLFITLLHNITFQRMVKNRKSVTDPEIINILKKCCAEMKVNRSVQLVALKQIRVPVLYGLLNPKILLPAHFPGDLEHDDLKHIFMHELSHLKRYDLFIAWVMTLLQIFHWFNPLIWFAFFRVRIDREMACDAGTLATIGADGSRAYGQTILSLLQHISSEYRLPVAVGILESRTDLKRRLTMITRFRKPTLWWTLAGVLLLMTIGCFSLTEARRETLGVDEYTEQIEAPSNQIAVQNNESEIVKPANISSQNSGNSRNDQRTNPDNRRQISSKNEIQSQGQNFRNKRTMQDISSNADRIFHKDGFGIINIDGKYGFVDRNNNIIIEPKFQDADNFCEGLARVKQNFKWGFIDKTGMWMIDPIFNNAYSFTEGLAAVKGNRGWGFINHQGDTVVSLTYDHVRVFREGLAPVEEFFHWGYIDSKGNEVIRPQFGEAMWFFNDRARIKYFDSEKWGFINRAGEVVVEPAYLEADDYSEGLAAVRFSNHKMGYIDLEGNVTIEPRFDVASTFQSGKAIVSIFEGMGSKEKPGGYLIDTEGNIIHSYKKPEPTVDSTYDATKGLSEGLQAVRMDGRWGFVDENDSLVIQCEFREVWPFKEGLARFAVNDKSGYYKYGYINRKGETVIPAQFRSTSSDFSEGLAAVRMSDGGVGFKDGYIDREGNVVIEPRFDHAGDFKDGKALTITYAGTFPDSKGVSRVIDKTGKVLSESILKTEVDPEKANQMNITSEDTSHKVLINRTVMATGNEKLFGEKFRPRVLLHAGHGGIDPGAIAPNGVKEKDLNLNFVQRLKIYLTQLGVDVFLTRTDDNYFTLSELRAMENKWDADLAIKVHHESTKDTVYSGSAIYHNTRDPESLPLGHSIKTALIHAFPSRAFLMTNVDLAELAEIGIPVVYLGVGFLSNKADYVQIRDEEFQNKFAYSAALGIRNYLLKR